jgi:hypothetical protein
MMALCPPYGVHFHVKVKLGKGKEDDFAHLADSLCADQAIWGGPQVLYHISGMALYLPQEAFHGKCFLEQPKGLRTETSSFLENRLLYSAVSVC